MKHFSDYIIQESIKDTIKGLINKFKKTKEPEKIYTEDDLKEYKDKTITEEDAEKIMDIRSHLKGGDFLKYTKDNQMLNGDVEIYRLAFKQALLDYAYMNFKGILDHDKFGESSCDNASYRMCKDNGEDPFSIGAGYFHLLVIPKYFHGWTCAENLKLKCEQNIKINFKLKKNINK